MTIKTSNRNCRAYVQERIPFTAANIYAITTNRDLYVVYSYGEHFPLFIYYPQTDTWLENSDRYSATTSRHRTQAHPHPSTDTIKLNTEDLKAVIETGTITGIVTPMNN